MACYGTFGTKCFRASWLTLASAAAAPPGCPLCRVSQKPSSLAFLSFNYPSRVPIVWNALGLRLTFCIGSSSPTRVSPVCSDPGHTSPCWSWLLWPVQGTLCTKHPVAISWFFSRNLQARREWHHVFKMFKGKKIYKEEYSTQKDYHWEWKKRVTQTDKN